MTLEQTARHFTKVDPEIADAGTVRHREVGGDPYQQLVQRQPLRPERHEFAGREPGETLHLGSRSQSGEDILRTKDR